MNVAVVGHEGFRGDYVLMVTIKRSGMIRRINILQGGQGVESSA